MQMENPPKEHQLTTTTYQLTIHALVLSSTWSTFPIEALTELEFTIGEHHHKLEPTIKEQAKGVVSWKDEVVIKGLGKADRAMRIVMKGAEAVVEVNTRVSFAPETKTVMIAEKGLKGSLAMKLDAKKIVSHQVVSGKQLEQLPMQISISLPESTAHQQVNSEITEQRRQSQTPTISINAVSQLKDTQQLLSPQQDCHNGFLSQQLTISSKVGRSSCLSQFSYQKSYGEDGIDQGEELEGENRGGRKIVEGQNGQEENEKEEEIDERKEEGGEGEVDGKGIEQVVAHQFVEDITERVEQYIQDQQQMYEHDSQHKVSNQSQIKSETQQISLEQIVAHELLQEYTERVLDFVQKQPQPKLKQQSILNVPLVLQSIIPLEYSNFSNVPAPLEQPNPQNPQPSNIPSISALLLNRQPKTEALVSPRPSQPIPSNLIENPPVSELPSQSNCGGHEQDQDEFQVECLQVQLQPVAVKDFRPSNQQIEETAPQQQKNLQNMQPQQQPTDPTFNPQQQHPWQPSQDHTFRKYQQQLCEQPQHLTTEQALEVQDLVKSSMSKIGQWLLKERMDELHTVQTEPNQPSELFRNSMNKNLLTSYREEHLQSRNKKRKNSLFSRYKSSTKKGGSPYESFMIKSGSFKSTYGDKIYQNQSATTMQKSVLSYSVPKATRFSDCQYLTSGTTYYTGTCFGKGKGTSFGFGERKPYPLWMQRNMKEYPAPNTYLNKMPSSDVTAKGFTFGVSFKHYEKTGVCGTEPLRKSQGNTTTQFRKGGKIRSKKEVVVVGGVLNGVHGNGSNYHYQQLQAMILR